MDHLKKIENMALFMRRKILDISFQSSHAAHLGGGLSMVEIMATLYAHILNFDKNKPTISFDLHLNCKKAEKELNWKPKTDIKTLVKEMVSSELKILNR
jgi:GDP-D-mannose dehydratase